jgi:hypothetical protein
MFLDNPWGIPIKILNTIKENNQMLYTLIIYLAYVCGTYFTTMLIQKIIINNPKVLYAAENFVSGVENAVLYTSEECFLKGSRIPAAFADACGIVQQRKGDILYNKWQSRRRAMPLIAIRSGRQV